MSTRNAFCAAKVLLQQQQQRQQLSGPPPAPSPWLSPHTAAAHEWKGEMQAAAAELASAAIPAPSLDDPVWRQSTGINRSGHAQLPGQHTRVHAAQAGRMPAISCPGSVSTLPRGPLPRGTICVLCQWARRRLGLSYQS